MVLDDNIAERMIPEASDEFTFWEHAYRCAFAYRLVVGKRVLRWAANEAIHE
jgi:hypothetical protein